MENKIKFVMVKSGGKVHAYNATRGGKVCGRIVPTTNLANTVKLWEVVEGLPGKWVKIYKSIAAAKAAVSAYYESIPAARKEPTASELAAQGFENVKINTAKAKEKTARLAKSKSESAIELLDKVMQDLKNQGDSKASVVLEMLEDTRYNLGEESPDLLETCASEVVRMGGWGKAAARQLRGEPLTPADKIEKGEATPWLWLEEGEEVAEDDNRGGGADGVSLVRDYNNGGPAVFIPESMKHSSELLKALRGLMEYTGGWDSKPGHPCAVAAALLKKLEGK